MESKIREPKQKRSIEKKDRIIKKGFQLICEKGYHHINTDDIAAYAGVSTGTIYNYFIDKKDIFMQGIAYYAPQILFPLENEIELFDFSFDTLKETITQIILNCITVHENNKKVHEEITSMSHSDIELANWIQQRELELSNNITETIRKNHFEIINLSEKVHIIIGLIENLCHEVVYHQHPTIDSEKYKEEIINTIVMLLSS